MKLYLLLGLLLVAHAWAKPQDAENEIENDNEPEEEYEEEENYDEENNVEGGYGSQTEDPCSQKECEIGRECEVVGGEAYCTCAHHCPNEPELFKVCSTTNVTFNSLCELRRQKCLCQEQQSGCEDVDYSHAILHYYGPCKEMTECSEEELEEFPKRMRVWHALVMDEMVERKEVGQRVRTLAKQAERQDEPWVLPTIWKFCTLDNNHDLYIDPEEILSIQAPLLTMEHCTGKFFERCDSNNDGNIHMEEWRECLGVTKDLLKKKGNKRYRIDEDSDEFCRSLDD